MPIRVRVGAVVVHEGRILLVNHRRMGRSYWVFPGGALEGGESLAACASREVREETGLEVFPERLLYLVELFPPGDGGRHSVDVLFLAHLSGAEKAPRAVAGWAIERPELVPLQDLPALALLPPIAGEILADAASGFSNPPRHLTNRWVAPSAAPAPRAPAEGTPRLSAGRGQP